MRGVSPPLAKQFVLLTILFCNDCIETIMWFDEITKKVVGWRVPVTRVVRPSYTGIKRIQHHKLILHTTAY